MRLPNPLGILKREREKKEKILPSKVEEKPSLTLEEEIANVKDTIAPSALEVDFDHLKIGERFFRTIFVSGYPRFVGANWLSPLINFDHSLEISMFYYPVSSHTVLDDLRRKIAEMEATTKTDIERGKVVDPSVQAALDDALSLQEQLVKGVERFFQFSFYITIPAETKEELEHVTKRVEATLGSLMIISKHATLQMEEAFKTTIPTCQDKLLVTRNMDTTAIATTFPFTSSELTANEGVLYGINGHNGSLIIFDRFTLENANSIVFGKAGVGKSVSGSEPVLVKDERGKVQLRKIGEFTDLLIKERGITWRDKELEGVIGPSCSVFTFDKNLKGHWSPVVIAARKKAPKNLYRFKTAGGREITVTGDHNLLILKEGKITATKSEKVRKGRYIPLPRALPQPKKPQKELNLFALFSENKYIYVEGGAFLINKYYKDLKKVRIDPKLDQYLRRYARGRRISLPYFLKILKVLKIELSHPRLDNVRLGSCKFKKRASFPPFLPINSAFLRLLGYITSEGTVTKDFVGISNTNPSVLRNIRQCVRGLGINAFPVRGGVTIGTRVFTELLKAVEGGGYSGQKRVPPFIFNLENEKVAEFLRTYFEGDGTVGEHEVSATSKSKELISDLSYLLLRFGITTRIKKTFKKATNSEHKGGDFYQIFILDQRNLMLFAENIGFITKEKNKKLKKLLGKKYNTNVDVIPSLEPVFEEIYEKLYSSTEIKSPPNFSDLKKGDFKPSRQLLRKTIKIIEGRIKELEDLEPQLIFLNKLPKLSTFLEVTAKDKHLNHLLWQELGQSWRLMKRGEVSPRTRNVLRAIRTVNGKDYNLPQIKQTLYTTYKVLGESLQGYNKSLWTAVTQRPKGDTSYEGIRKAAKFLTQRHKKLQLELVTLEQKLETLKMLAESDLFWDQIIKVEKVKNREKYVYDLSVNDGVFLTGFGGMFVHNSYLIKTEALRSLMFGAEVIILDPEAEYKELCQAVGGEFIGFSQSEPSKINPFDLSGVYTEGENELGFKILTLHTLFKIIFGKLTPTEEAILDRALVLTYKMKGITPDPETQKKEPPLMEDLYKALSVMEEEEAHQLVQRLERYVKGSLAGIFDQRTNVDIKNPFTVFSIRDLEDKLRPIAMFIILDYIWNRIKREMKKRILIVDETWYLMQHPDSAQFMYSIAKRARKYYVGLTTITQDVEDILGSDYGRAIVTNSSIQILLKQHPAAIDLVAKVFYLSEGEKRFLLACDIGEGLFFAGANHVAMKVVASPEEHELITTKPAEILERERRRKEEATTIAKEEKEKGSPEEKPTEEIT